MKELPRFWPGSKIRATETLTSGFGERRDQINKDQIYEVLSCSSRYVRITTEHMTDEWGVASFELVEDASPDYIKAYRQCWQQIVLDGDGEIDGDKLARELADYGDLLQAVSYVYDELTGGRISKPNTVPNLVIAAAVDTAKKDFADDLIDCLLDEINDEQAREAVIKYARELDPEVVIP